MREDIDQILGRVLSGNADSDDFLALNEWLSQDEKNRLEFHRLKNYWDAEVHCDRAENSSAMERVWSGIEWKKKSHKNISFYRWTAAAACAALALVIGILYFTTNQRVISEHEYTYMAGNSRTVVQLEDGSKVTLNKNSRLSYTDEFGKVKREVKLEGEAFFAVAKDAQHPFIVSAKQSQIKVLGTKFNVYAPLKNDEVIVTLVEGSVCFTTGREKKVMKPAEQLICRGSNLKLLTIDPDSTCAWKDGLYKYKSIELAKLIQCIEMRFSVKIKMNIPLALDTMKVTASFREGQSVEEMLDIISGSLPLTWSKKGEVYILR